MPKKTIKLFGYPRSRYEPEITILATKRIKDGRELMKKFVEKRKTMSSLSYEEQDKIIKSYQETEKAVEWWEKILEEE